MNASAGDERQMALPKNRVLRRVIPTYQQLAIYRSFLVPACAISVVVVIAALAEAAALVMVVPMVDIVSTNGADSFTGQVGPIEVTLGTNALMAVTASLILLSTALALAAAALRGATVSSWERNLRSSLMSAYISADSEYQSSLGPGRLQELLGQHVVRAAEGLAAATAGMKAALSLLVLLAGALFISPVAAMFLGLLGSLLMLGLRPLMRRSKASAREIAKTDVRLGSAVSLAAGSARDIRVFDAGRGVLTDYDRGVDHLRRNRRRSATFAGSIPALYQGGGLLIFLALLGAAVTSDSRDLPALGATALLLLRALSYGQQLSTTHQRFVQALPFARRLYDERQDLDEHAVAFGTDSLQSVETIRLDDVGYRYPESESDAVSNVSFVLESPGIVGLAGPSGSGKSTLTALLLRLRSPTTGRILANGQDVASYDEDSWAANVSLVPQDVLLLDASVIDNILFHRSSISIDEVATVCRRLGLDSLFTSMPDGYDTLIGPGNRELSGGQRQRLGIARALVGQPSVLILDEPTSSLDHESEEWVHSILSELRNNCLVIVTSHRSTTLAICDHVIDVVEGRIESGVMELDG